MNEKNIDWIHLAQDRDKLRVLAKKRNENLVSV
jgi:hypothetical protein